MTRFVEEAKWILENSCQWLGPNRNRMNMMAKVKTSTMMMRLRKNKVNVSNVEIGTTAEQFPNQPYQPDDVSCIPVQTHQNRKLKFQHKWFIDFPWLHFDQSTGGVLCHWCASASRQNLTQLARCSDEAFVSKGFRNWKKSTDKFRQYEKSTTHKLAIENLKF